MGSLYELVTDQRETTVDLTQYMYLEITQSRKFHVDLQVT